MNGRSIKMDRSKLSQHRKIGDTLYSPFSFYLGDNIKESSWRHEKLPQFIWIALILSKFGRDYAFKLFSGIIEELEKQELCIAELSEVLSLPEKEQKKWYDTIDLFIPKEVLSPLTIVFSSREHPYFFNRYCMPELDLELKISKLTQAIERNLAFHSSESTDICFIVIWFYIRAKRISFSNECNMVREAITEYYRHSHDDEIMSVYRPSIRATMQGLTGFIDFSFSHKFWDQLARLTACKPMIINYTYEDNLMGKEFLADSLKTLEFIGANTKDKYQSTKFTVSIGIVTYIVKLYSEILNHELQNTVSGRIIFRTMTEAYINLKYLLYKEQSTSDVFNKFQSYGLGKYKLVMAKLREEKYQEVPDSHINSKILELYVNEVKDEEFTPINLGYFDRDNIKKKFDLVGEMELYEIYYDYDTNFVHAFWGAIRESSMLLCDNPAHLYHSIPDYTMEQMLQDVDYDCIMILKKVFSIISSYVELPEFFTTKYDINYD